METKDASWTFHGSCGSQQSFLVFGFEDSPGEMLYRPSIILLVARRSFLEERNKGSENLLRELASAILRDL